MPLPFVIGCLTARSIPSSSIQGLRIRMIASVETVEKYENEAPPRFRSLPGSTSFFTVLFTSICLYRCLNLFRIGHRLSPTVCSRFAARAKIQKLLELFRHDNLLTSLPPFKFYHRLKKVLNIAWESASYCSLHDLCCLKMNQICLFSILGEFSE